MFEVDLDICVLELSSTRRRVKRITWSPSGGEVLGRQKLLRVWSCEFCLHEQGICHLRLVHFSVIIQTYATQTRYQHYTVITVLFWKHLVAVLSTCFDPEIRLSMLLWFILTAPTQDVLYCRWPSLQRAGNSIAIRRK